MQFYLGCRGDDKIENEQIRKKIKTRLDWFAPRFDRQASSHDSQQRPLFRSRYAPGSGFYILKKKEKQQESTADLTPCRANSKAKYQQPDRLRRGSGKLIVKLKEMAIKQCNIA